MKETEKSAGQWLARVLLPGLTAMLTACFGSYYIEFGPTDDGGEDVQADMDAAAEDTLPDPQEEEMEEDAAPDLPEDVEEEEEIELPESCEFDYDDTFIYSVMPPAWVNPPAFGLGQGALDPTPGPDMIAHVEPLPPRTYEKVLGSGISGSRDGPDYTRIVMPEYSDTMPLFERGADWTEETRCYETPLGVMLLAQDEAFDLYRAIAELTTGVAMDVTPGVRTVVGVRGAYPGRFLFHGNLPNRFNDTLVLLWIDGDGARHVREFPVNTDTGAYDFGYHASSSIRPNRRYFYINGWHRTYNALHIDEATYNVRDDANKNGHWDSDRNGWLPPNTDADHDRTGSGHNIHMGSVDGPLGSAVVGVWSAGCQVIPGMANWTEFIENAWTEEGDRVNYFIVDVRDIDPRVWWGECEPDGSHACPFWIESFPFEDSGDTSASPVDVFDVYNCSTADESGPEIVYVFTLDRTCSIAASVTDGESVDVDIHLLDADDALACLTRDDTNFDIAVGPGRYFFMADSYVSDGTVLAGPFTVNLTCN
jgi:hypothetical protein